MRHVLVSLNITYSWICHLRNSTNLLSFFIDDILLSMSDVIQNLQGRVSFSTWLHWSLGPVFIVFPWTVWSASLLSNLELQPWLASLLSNLELYMIRFTSLKSQTACSASLLSNLKLHVQPHSSQISNCMFSLTPLKSRTTTMISLIPLKSHYYNHDQPHSSQISLLHDQPHSSQISNCMISLTPLKSQTAWSTSLLSNLELHDQPHSSQISYKIYRGDYKHWTWGSEDPESRGLCCTVAVKIQAICANATSLTHGYVLYVVTMHTESVIYSRQRYIWNYPLTSLILRVV